ncbi:MAG: FtsQ-type POTRA domain-containing protein [Pseudomonadota bacterium]
MSERVILKRGQKTPAKRARAKPARSKRPASASTPARPWLAPTLAVLAAVVALGTAWLYQLPERLWLGAAKGVAAIGFEVRDVDVSGTRHMARLPVYTAALDGASDSMLLVDLDDVKARLELLPWVAEASVGRVLPDRLTIDIVERRPIAIWQNEGRHRLIDAEGRILQTEDLARFAALPLVVDEGADREAGALVALLADYPAVEEHFASAIWRGGRRWDIQLKSGETLLLPEDGAAVRRALDAFVRLDRDTGLVGRGFVSLDFRVPAQMVVRTGAEENVVTTVAGTEI